MKNNNVIDLKTERLSRVWLTAFDNLVEAGIFSPEFKRKGRDFEDVSINVNALPALLEEWLERVHGVGPDHPKSDKIIDKEFGKYKNDPIKMAMMAQISINETKKAV